MIPYATVLNALEEIIKEAETAQHRNELGTATDALAQAWGLCRLWSHHLVDDGNPDTLTRMKFDELEKRRKAVNKWRHRG